MFTLSTLICALLGLVLGAGVLFFLYRRRAYHVICWSLFLLGVGGLGLSVGLHPAPSAYYVALLAFGFILLAAWVKWGRPRRSRRNQRSWRPAARSRRVYR